MHAWRRRRLACWWWWHRQLSLHLWSYWEGPGLQEERKSLFWQLSLQAEPWLHHELGPLLVIIVPQLGSDIVLECRNLSRITHMTWVCLIPPLPLRGASDFLAKF